MTQALLQRTALVHAPRRGLVTLVIPAKNEQAAIGPTLRALPRATLLAAGLDVEVLVLDGNSTDLTATIARDHGATVIPDRSADGKGTALRDARPLFRGDYVVMLDADGTYPPDAIPSLLVPLLVGDADIAMGRRVPTPGAMSASHRVGNVLLSTAATLLYGRRCPDLCTGLWAFRADALRQLPLRSRRFGLEAELFALACRRRLRIAQVPADYLPRRGAGSAPKLQFGRDGTRIVLRLLRTRVARLPKPLALPAPALPTGAAASPNPAEGQA
jgi:dolichol-phosphate mannosyltransferase